LNTAKPPHAGLVLATACLCQVMVVLDVSVVNVALPSIDQALGFSGASLSWVVNAYAVVFGGLLLLGGRIADMVGQRRALLAGLALFGLASVLGGFAQNPGQLIAARAGQGVAGAVLAPLSLTIIMVTFTEGPARTRAVGIWAMVAACGSALGVLLGGVLTDLLNWRWVMFVNVPFVIATAALAWRSVHERRAMSRPRLDVPGAILGTAAVTLLVYAMVHASDTSWGDSTTVVTLVLSVLAGAAFVGWEQRGAAEPLVRLSIFSVRTVWVSNLTVLFIGAASVAGFYFASLFLQDVLGYTPMQAGAAFLPFCVGVIIGARSSSALAARFGSRVTITLGLILGGVGMFLFSLLDTDSTFLTGFLPPSIVASIGIGICMVTNTTMATSGVAHHEAGLVSGLVNASRQIGGSIGLAALTTVAVSVARSSVTSGSDAIAAAAHGYSRAFLVTGILVLIAAALAAVFAPTGARATEPDPALEAA
jgi:EmrB/QacA subfamily drug resistance transporter